MKLNDEGDGNNDIFLLLWKKCFHWRHYFFLCISGCRCTLFLLGCSNRLTNFNFVMHPAFHLIFMSSMWTAMEELLVHCSGRTGWTLRKVGLWDIHKISLTELYGTPICHYTVAPTNPCSERRWWRSWEGISGFKLGWVRVKRVILVVMLCDHITREMQVLSMQCSVVLARTILSFNISSLLIA